MADDFRSLVKEYHVFYEVLPYYIAVEERRGDRVIKSQRIQAGFNVDVYGVSNTGRLELAPQDDLSLGSAQLNRIAETVSHGVGDCLIEVIHSPSIYLDARAHFQPEAKFRIQISHAGVDQPAGVPEQRALAEVERELKNLGIPHR